MSFCFRLFLTDRADNHDRDTALGICGQHGGEPESVKFCHRIGLNYVSCSPFRVPIARLAAAQATLQGAAERDGRSISLSRTLVMFDPR